MAFPPADWQMPWLVRTVEGEEFREVLHGLRDTKTGDVMVACLYIWRKKCYNTLDF